MSKLAQLRERRNAKALEANTLNNTYPADQRMPQAEIEKLDAILAEIEVIDNEISREIRLTQLAGEQLANDPQALHEHALNAATRIPGAQNLTEETQALRTFLTAGLGGLSQDQRQGCAAAAAASSHCLCSGLTMLGAVGPTGLPKIQLMPMRIKLIPITAMMVPVTTGGKNLSMRLTTGAMRMEITPAPMIDPKIN